jgi:hypothetical protein
MRALTYFTVLWGVGFTASAQAPVSQNTSSGADFSGIYESAVFVNVAPVLEPDVYPFTAEGRRSFESYDALAEATNQADDCAAYTMPGILWANSPMQIVQGDETIVFRYETGGVTRSIPMSGPMSSGDTSSTELGHSIGHWEGEVLIVETTGLIDGVLRNNRGYPISREATITERYWRDGERNDLQMELLVNDPTNYTEPFTLGREWIWAPDEDIRPYECVSLGPRDEEPDIDELIRLLEEL